MSKPNNYRPYDDGICNRQLRRKLRRECYSNLGKKKPIKNWTEKHCAVCRVWNHRDRPEDWCEHMKQDSETDMAPAAHVFRPFYHPNIQPGGAWIRSADAYRRAQKICGKEPY